MRLKITALDEYWQPRVLEYLRRAPYRNAIPLSNVTQLRERCTVLVAHRQDLLQGMISYYRDLPFPAVTFVAEPGQTLPALLEALAAREPALRNTELTAVVPEYRARQLDPCTTVLSLETEWQMVVEPETLRPRAGVEVRRLLPDDNAAMAGLAATCGLVAWRPSVLDHGPAFGAFDGTMLVAMAATHFATTEVIEIGNVATHPAYRRRGLASACVSALAGACFTLAPRVYLMVMEEQRSAFSAYRGLGFYPLERFAFARFTIPL